MTQRLSQSHRRRLGGLTAYTLTLQPAAAAGIDTWLLSNDPTNNRAGDSDWRIYKDNQYTGLIKFDLSTIPAGAVITAATLYLTLRLAGNAMTLTLSRILAANSGWTEAAANHNTQDGSTPWAGSAGCATAGTDYAATPLYSGAVDTTLETKAFALDTAQFTAMIAANYGIVGHGSGTGYRYFHSSDSATPTARPKLIVEYQA